MESEWTFLPNEVVLNHTTPGMSNGGNTPGTMQSLPKLSEQVPQVHDFSNDHFLLQNIDHTHLQTEFDLDGIDFIVPEDLGANSKAFPPSEYPQNTPALNPRPNRAPAPFQLPILPSQNERLFNEEHLLHKQRQRRHAPHQQHPNQPHVHSNVQNAQNHTNHANHVRPDAVFTPLVSPAVTPRSTDVNNNKNPYGPVQTSFEPLTLPALNAQPPQMNTDRRRLLLATFGGEDYAPGNSVKRRTPHLTPNLAAHPGSKMKRSPSLRKVPQTGQNAQNAQGSQNFEALPDSLYENATKSSETTPMLPPQSKRFVIDGPVSGSATPNVGPVGPGTMMGFTMNRLAELQSNQLLSPSPSLGAVNSKLPRKTRRDSGGRRDSSSSQWLKNYGNNNSSLSDASPVIEAQNGEFGGKREKPATKKASHKLAEQGRRNRMNQAVYELLKLIPSNYHEQVSIPSKATTVELAASYIKDLLDEISELKYNGS